jgi:hypothetical protein
VARLGFDPSREAQHRVGQLSADFRDALGGAAVEVGWREVLQYDGSETQRRLGVAGRVDAWLAVGARHRLTARHQWLNSFIEQPDDLTEEAALGYGFRNDHETVSMAIWLERRRDETAALAEHRIRFLWRLRP